ncbi:MAG: hypothetical protein MUC91_03835 [Verrucomicrobia bacterium]|nr:hypothetical protein [Verrucomicrobiota bacterium]
MPDLPTQPKLLWSLGRLVRGLSAVFWGLPLTLLVSVGVARMGWFRSMGIVPVLAMNLLLLFGLWQMGAFQPQERIWRLALDRARLLAMINCGLSPFLFWWSRVPHNEFFSVMLLLATCCALIFLISLNLVLRRLSAMLPDETLRAETRSFATLNRILLLIMLVLVVLWRSLDWWPDLVPLLGPVLYWVQTLGFWLIVFLVLLPLAMTMALVWKTKEVILENVFSHKA